MDVLYYSNNCKHSQKLLAHLAKLGLLEKYNFVCIDRRSVDPNTRQITITLDRGLKTTLPPNVSRVPTLLLVNQKYTAVVGDDIYNYIEKAVSSNIDPDNLAYDNGGEPIGYILAPSSGGVSIVSETYTMYNAPPEELAAKGTGGTRQMYNYASAKIDPNSIPTPQDQTQRSRNAEQPESRRNSNIVEDTTVPGMMTANRGMFPTNSTTYNAYSVPGVMYNTGQVIVPELQRPPPHRHAKIGEDVTLDSLQQKRNSEIQSVLPQIAHQLNQAILPEVSNIHPPLRDQTQLQKLTADNSREIFDHYRTSATAPQQKQYASEICYL
jgi:hypothetical protein